ncbi:preprotein translocase subunit YajC [Actinorhabdospora filicis]|uniref:Preprotein translocase subunit YajC n=1 Tax=Actinorhabdospora filicis TaxID=1785913 RepID=A0A9W6W7F7_9ACTN|nr:preprotein translocase subunit YajC [Actinorhabdospora filicis]GLZ75441.1 preprotein translocase subunit YajC [Actinorhabdospora filicis]
MLLAESAAGGGNFLIWGLLALMFVAMYFFMIRPQKKRQREQQEMQQAAGPGTRIVTIGGLHGTIIANDDETVTLEISDGVQVVFARQAIGRVLPSENTDDVAEEAEEDAESGNEETVASVEETNDESTAKKN